MLILSLNLACFPHRKVRDSMCVYFIFNQKKCDMLKSERRSSVEKNFGLMFQSKGFVFNKFDPDPEEPEEEEEGGANNPPPPVPPVSGN
ncbi:hypothetical protein OB69_15325 [Roseivirga seohaensis subsp. aquiponti]|uniref:Uncharacterized protein n=2 Tax=Roseivirga seohaensis TaxID=1914963 RepID=A0A0L8AHH0_9BACT|nr:hypothetical protein OB69_15325 [Roseivirga seohaensis subsp. aquiponti]